MPVEMSVKYGYYGPLPFNFRLGGNRYFDFIIQFGTPPPQTFNYTLRIKNHKYEVVRTFSKTGAPVNQQDATGTIHEAWDGKNDYGNPVPYGSYRPWMDADVPGDDPITDYGYCGGGNNDPGGNPGGEPGGDDGCSDPCVCPTEPGGVQPE